MITHLCLVFVFLWAAWQQNLPQHSPLSDEYRSEWQQAYSKWRPGPNVAATVKRLDDRARELRDQLSREEITVVVP